MKNSTIGAIFVTVIWLSGVITLVCLKWRDFQGLEPNEWGDFLGGSIASPLALIWLVAGYLQQGDELKLNTKALLMQQDELAKQVAETKRLAEYSQSQSVASHLMAEMTKKDKENREKLFLQGQMPDLDLDLYEWLEHLCCKVTNHGGDIFDLKFSHDTLGELDFDCDRLRRGQHGQLDVNLINSTQDIIHVQFQTLHGLNMAMSYRVENGVIKKLNG